VNVDPESPPFDSSPYSGVRVVVLGATGFIGRWVGRALARAGAETALVVRSTARAGPMLEAMEVEGELIESDLGDPARAAGLLAHLGPSITFNLIGYGVDPTERDPAVAEQINTQLPRCVAEACGATADPDWPGQQLVHVGSALEYGRAGGDLSEDSRPQPIEMYGRTKLAGTVAVADVCTRDDVAAVTARLFTVYGPGEHSGRLLPSLLETARSGRPLELTGGTQRRDFTYVGDVAEGLLRLGVATPQAGSVVNLCTGRLETVRAFAEIAGRVLSIPAELLRFGARPARSTEMEHGEVSIERLMRLTGWRPSTPIAQGIAATAAFEESAGRWPSR
jgi:UDP-glucose 4-epimerase